MVRRHTIQRNCSTMCRRHTRRDSRNQLCVVAIRLNQFTTIITVVIHIDGDATNYGWSPYALTIAQHKLPWLYTLTVMQPKNGHRHMLEQNHNADFGCYTRRWSRNQRLVIAI